MTIYHRNFFTVGIGPENHPGHPRSTTHFWSGSDSEENFRKQPTTGYTETSITYQFNSAGFRTREFDYSSSKPRVLFLGCSHTMGVGLRVEDRWSSHIEPLFDETHDCYNLGIGGCSGNTVARMLINSVEKLTPDIVFIFWPPLPRFETYALVDEDNVNSIIEPIFHISGYATKYQLYLFSEENLLNWQARDKLIVNLLAEKHKIKIIEIDSDDWPDTFINKYGYPSDRARDNHFSPSIHLALANEFIQLYDNSKI